MTRNEHSNGNALKVIYKHGYEFKNLLNNALKLLVSKENINLIKLPVKQQSDISKELRMKIHDSEKKVTTNEEVVTKLAYVCLIPCGFAKSKLLPSFSL